MNDSCFEGDSEQAVPVAGPDPAISLHGQEQPETKAKATAKAVIDKGVGGQWLEIVCMENFKAYP